jgi:hypothetical protein
VVRKRAKSNELEEENPEDTVMGEFESRSVVERPKQGMTPTSENNSDRGHSDESNSEEEAALVEKAVSNFII